MIDQVFDQLMVALVLCFWFCAFVRIEKRGGFWTVFGGYRIRDLLNPKKWLSFVKGYFFIQFARPHILQQIMIRQTVCGDCVKAGYCLNCKCAMPEKSYDLKAECSLGKWGKVEKDKSVWEKIVEEYKIKIAIFAGGKEIN